MTDRAATDAIVEKILTAYDTITVVGASADPAKAANEVPAHMQQHGWRIIPVNPHAEEIVGEPVYRSIADIPEQVGLVDVFRPSADCAAVARAQQPRRVPRHCGCNWGSPRPRRAIAADAGMAYVEDRCLIIEQRRSGIVARR